MRGNHTGDGAVSHIYDSTELNSFLDDGNCGVLGARVELTQDVKIVQVYSGTLPEMELQEVWRLRGKSVLRRLHSTHHTGGGGLDSSRSFEGGIIDDGWVSGEVMQRACDTGTAKECSASVLESLQWL